MHTKRIIPCLDVRDGKVVKGINFKGIINVGDPVSLGKYYYQAGADELVFLDITATCEGRGIMKNVVEKVAKNVFIPFTVGGGIAKIDDIRTILRAGADKVSLNSAAVRNKRLIEESADCFGSQCIVLAVDAQRNSNNRWDVMVNGGRINTGIDALKWIEEAVKLGVGELLLTSMDADGTKNGFDIELMKAVNNIVDIPVIASGGAGKKEDFYEVFKYGKADGALAASLFHYNELEIKGLKEYLLKKNIDIRI